MFFLAAILKWGTLHVPLAATMNPTWHLIPLAVAVSLVYSSSRYELPERILSRAVRLFCQIMGFMLFAFAVLWFLSWGL